jgi:quinol monooxygenase YgiN
MSVLVTMRVKVNDFEGTRKAIAKYGPIIKESGCLWYKVYQRDNNPKEVLWLLEFENHEAYEKTGAKFEDDFVEMVQPIGYWDDAVWMIAIEG